MLHLEAFVCAGVSAATGPPKFQVKIRGLDEVAAVPAPSLRAAVGNLRLSTQVGPGGFGSAGSFSSASSFNAPKAFGRRRSSDSSDSSSSKATVRSLVA